MLRRFYIFIVALTLLSCTGIGRGAIVVPLSDCADGRQQQETVVDAMRGHLSVCGLQGETVSLPPCVTVPSAHTSVPAVKNHRTNVLQCHGSLFRLRTRITSHYSTLTLFAKAGLAFVSPRACSYFVYALRRMRC